MRRARSSSLASRALIVLATIAFLAGRPAATAAETPQPSASYAPDRIIVLFRTAPTDTELEAFEGRQFLSLAAYIGLDYPPREGWDVFHIEDRMDASLVRGLLHADPLVCLAELIRRVSGTRRRVLHQVGKMPQTACHCRARLPRWFRYRLISQVAFRGLPRHQQAVRIRGMPRWSWFLSRPGPQRSPWRLLREVSDPPPDGQVR